MMENELTVSALGAAVTVAGTGLCFYLLGYLSGTISAVERSSMRITRALQQHAEVTVPVRAWTGSCAPSVTARQEKPRKIKRKL